MYKYCVPACVTCSGTSSLHLTTASLHVLHVGTMYCVPASVTCRDPHFAIVILHSSSRDRSVVAVDEVVALVAGWTVTRMELSRVISASPWSGMSYGMISS